MQQKITIGKNCLYAEAGTNLLELLREYRYAPDAPCGGNGKCGKCKVMVDGREQLACRYMIDSDITVEIPYHNGMEILTAGLHNQAKADPLKEGYLIAFDIGTTSVVCFLMSAAGEELAVESMLNPQYPYGADVISRIQYAQKGNRQELTDVIRAGMTKQINACCTKAEIHPKEIGVVSVVGNPCMQQLFLGMDVSNLAAVPFAPLIKKAEVTAAVNVLPVCTNADLILVPDISGYVGADTIGCVLATKMYEAKDTVLMVDIGTNGEMVLSHNGHMVACSTAAGPALEGANIKFGMRGAAGAIDHVSADGIHVIADQDAKGICGSGLVDAVAVMLEKGLLNKRGRVMTEDHNYWLTDRIYLTQEDIRQVQMAKGAIAAGISLMASHFGIGVQNIDRCILAGAFGSFLNPENACRIGLLPWELRGEIASAGNIAGSGAKILALDRNQTAIAQELVNRIEFLELASLPDFQRTFAKSMMFRE